MNRTLSTNIHILSYLTFLELQNTKRVNKEFKKSYEDPILWKNLIKRDFFITKPKHSDYSEDLYKQYDMRIKNESAQFITCATAYLSIYQANIEKPFNPPTTLFYVMDDYEMSAAGLDFALKKGMDMFNIEFNSIYEGKKKSLCLVRGYAKDFIESMTSLDSKISATSAEQLRLKCEATNIKPSLSLTYYKRISNFMMLILPKINAVTIMHRILHTSTLSQQQLNDMLHIACQFLNAEMIAMFLKAGANPNVIQFYPSGGMKVTPLFQVFLSAWKFKSTLEEFTKSSQLLLESGADPDKSWDISRFTTARTLREYCKSILAGEDHGGYITWPNPIILNAVIGLPAMKLSQSPRRSI